MERFAAAAGIRFVHVPYPGLAPAMRDLLAGHIDAIFDTPGNALPHVASGGVKALAVTGRNSASPNCRMHRRSRRRLPGIVHTDWFAVVAPPKTPPEIATRLSQDDRRDDEAAGRRQAHCRVQRHGGRQATPAETGGADEARSRSNTAP